MMDDSLAPPDLVLNSIPISMATWKLLYTPYRKLLILRRPK